ncbi:MAG: hypothetical protein WC604_02800 [Candidatus Gracilibacteria bacterium]
MYDRAQFSDYYRNAFEEIGGKILRESDATIIGTKLEELAEYYCQDYLLDPIELDIEIEPNWEYEKYVERIPAHQRESIYQQTGDLDFECERINIEVPIVPNRDISKISQLQASTRSLSYSEDGFLFQGNKITFSVKIKGYGFSHSEDQIARDVEQGTQRIKELIQWKRADILAGNEKLKNEVLQLLNQRKQKIEQDDSKIDSLTQKIKIPLKKKENQMARKIEISEKPILKKIKPSPEQLEEYVLDGQKVLDIIAFLDNQGKQFEKTPKSYEKLNEEELRDILLSTLNSIFEGKATGETFSKKGKTDIYLNIDKGSILVFECKIWGGEKLYQDTIDQLRRYLTWRHNFGIMITFVKNKDFSNILRKTKEAIQSSSSYIGGLREINETHFVSIHKIEDDEKEVEIHHLIYSLYA